MKRQILIDRVDVGIHGQLRERADQRVKLRREGKASSGEPSIEERLLAGSIPRQECAVLNSVGEQVGEVTSGTMSPILGFGIALARVKPEYAKTGTELAIDIRGRHVEGRVTKTPFVKSSL